MEELQYELQQNKKRIAQEAIALERALKDLKAMLDNDQFGGTGLSNWTQGYIARDVSKIASSLARQRSLLDALAIIEDK